MQTSGGDGRPAPDTPTGGQDMTAPSAYTCTLSPAEIPSRAAQVRRLTDGLRSRERRDREVRLRFDPRLAPTVREFVRDESGCCAFFDFTVTEDDDAVELVVRAPAGAEALLASLFEVFGTAPGDGGGAA